MGHRYQLLSLLLAVLLVAVGCDQSSQNVDPVNANRYIISQNNSAAGDAESGSFAADSVTVPDTVDYFVQGFTIEKDYTWSVNESEVPVEVRSEETHVWERRDGEFVTVVFSSDDPLTSLDTPLDTTTITVNASGDDIDPETIEVPSVLPNAAAQIGRLGGLSTFAGLSESAEISSELAQEGNAYTVFAPGDTAFARYGKTPTQAVDEDEPVTSSVRADLVKYHIVATELQSGDISGTAETLLGNQTITFGSSNGDITLNGNVTVRQADLPSTNGTIHRLDGVLVGPSGPSTASIDFTDREVNEEAVVTDSTVTVDGSFLPEGGGFLVLHEGDANSNVVGSSEYLEPGIHNEVEITLDEDLSDDVTLGAVAYQDDDDDETYDPGLGGDSPYTLEGDDVIDYAEIQVSSD